MRKVRFEDNGVYHIYNRGVEKRDIFQDEGDRLRFVHHLFELNDTQKARNLTYHFSKSTAEIESASKRDQLVYILAFALMPNHFHLLLQQKENDGISKFMQKLGTGYTMFFNEKYTRTGILFQGRFKAVHVESDKQLRYVMHYIHLNPLSLCLQDNGNVQKLRYLKEYKWSSFPDYSDGRSFPSVTHRNNMLEMFGGVRKYEESFLQAMDYKTLPEDVEPALLFDRI
jgi:putative transposase